MSVFLVLWADESWGVLVTPDNPDTEELRRRISVTANPDLASIFEVLDEEFYADLPEPGSPEEMLWSRVGRMRARQLTLTHEERYELLLDAMQGGDEQ